MGFLSPPARPSRNEVADEELLLETAIRHCRRPGHAGVGVSQAQAVQAALPAGERRGRRASRALFVHRLRRLRRGASRRARPHRERAARARRRTSQQELLHALRDALAHTPQPSPRIPGVPLPGGLVGVAGYDLVRNFERLPARARVVEPITASSLSRAAIVAGVRSPDARRRAAARGQRERAQLAAQAGRAGAARRDSPERQAHPLRAGRRQPERSRVHSRRSSHEGVHRRRRRLPARVVGALRGRVRAGAVRNLSRAASAEPVAVHVLLRPRRLRGRRLLARSAGETLARSRADAADRGHAAARPRQRRGHASAGRAAGRSEGERRAHHAGRSRTQRSRPRRARRHRRRRIRIGTSSATAT